MPNLEALNMLGDVYNREAEQLGESLKMKIESEPQSNNGSLNSNLEQAIAARLQKLTLLMRQHSQVMMLAQWVSTSGLMRAMGCGRHHRTQLKELLTVFAGWDV